MKFYEMRADERAKVLEMIENIIGEKEEWITENMDRTERIQTRARYDRLMEKLIKIYEKSGNKALAMNFEDGGARKKGTTPSGKKWELEMNNGITDRSRYCGTLYIDGEAIFTSGTVAKAFEYILNA